MFFLRPHAPAGEGGAVFLLCDIVISGPVPMVTPSAKDGRGQRSLSQGLTWGGGHRAGSLRHAPLAPPAGCLPQRVRRGPKQFHVARVSRCRWPVATPERPRSVAVFRSPPLSPPPFSSVKGPGLNLRNPGHPREEKQNSLHLAILPVMGARTRHNLTIPLST